MCSKHLCTPALMFNRCVPSTLRSPHNISSWYVLEQQLTHQKESGGCGFDIGSQESIEKFLY